MEMKTLRHKKDDYLLLIKKHPLKRIGSEVEHEKAIHVLVPLAGRAELTEGEQQYMDALAVLIKEYEDQHHKSALPKADPLALLKFLMIERQMTTGDLGRIIGSQPAASLILNKNWAISKAHIRKLADYFAVNPGLFL
jgi:antitoxin component HigA of HigAB toxin-antitoxin module